MTVGNYTIKDMPEDDRPRERLERHGASALSNSELLAILLRSGTKNASAIDIANTILNDKGLPYLVQAEVGEMKKIHGLGSAKATQIKAAIELGRRVSAFRSTRPQIKMPGDVWELLKDEMQYLAQEEFRILILNTKNIVLGQETISVGTTNASLAVPREIFQKALSYKTVTAIILVHNHPSGDPDPSSEDLSITKRIVESGKIIGVDVLDHVIIGQASYISFKEKALL
jgi:DNA repair protein RadC